MKHQARGEMKDLLQNFRRYRRACRQFPDDNWSDHDFEQYRKDKAYLEEMYEKKRLYGFSVAANHAHEMLFLRCFDSDIPGEG